ncbi:TPA: hypothetical protein JI398_RS05020 [Acinetobacter baumannii]|uniref:hypothetical protein n=1 Tax=Acinetobacter baumannii TaxID=470 RepID=UPI000346FB9F|nr:hypothetical protein [Acinetobacter baumannii]AKQ31236.1 hypothetical protein ACX61_12725 [Acinetobacter baumannii]EHU1798670.1 hypothetical protein [Acinetobacter baumannii]KAA8936474.1 hypothetical protein DLI75_19250 [Acinetobacter baumannii]KAA8940866.1 hypothetical protein DLI74_09015 [Acinetobacter baumannii]KMV13194.1 hypothetical protein AB988_2608 [Acinetobacter baumannii]
MCGSKPVRQDPEADAAAAAQNAVTETNAKKAQRRTLNQTSALGSALAPDTAATKKKLGGGKWIKALKSFVIA